MEHRPLFYCQRNVFAGFLEITNTQLGVKPALGPNCMIYHILRKKVFIYGIIQFGSKVGLAPVY